MRSYKVHWVAAYNKWKAAGEYEAVLKMDPFDMWESNRLPHSTAREDFELALEIMYADPTSTFVPRLLERAILVADRALLPGWLSSGRRIGLFPANRSEATKIKAYAKALLGKGLDVDAVRAAERDRLDYCRQWPDVADETDRILAVRLALLAGDRTEAMSLLKEQSFKLCHEEAGFLMRLAGCAEGAAYRASAPASVTGWEREFEAWFDRIRDPEYGTKSQTPQSVGTMRFEIVAIRRRYFASLTTPADWLAVIEDISA